MIKNFYFKSFFIAAMALLFSCKSHFDLVRANRNQYAINSAVPADSAVIKTYLPYKLKMDEQMNAVIGRTDSALVKTRGPESRLGNFFADACLSEAKKIDNTIDFAMPSTTGGLRNSLPKGDIKLSNVFELMPFENELLVLKLKGKDVLDLCKFIAQTGGQPVSALKLKIENKAPVEILINGKAFDVSKTYNVLTSDYIAGGGDDSFGMANPLEKKVLKLKVRDALIQYIKNQTSAGKTITAQLDGRIVAN
ncbi:5'-nucleotidase C-terminal domain-containing protein [Pedobacter aquatilis]|uniref:5'-nucleotidase C-terminal domain-containing protein n=1 Tax=Pedobacter aquatilis TaxID=351343 RepID=UPI002930363B|nr:5'-nucleotidase C-terminal domain-containing protein [Pedobacter aquatilis]